MFIRTVRWMIPFLFSCSLSFAGIKAVIFDLGGVVVTSNQEGQAEFIAQSLKIPMSVIKSSLKNEIKPVVQGLIDENKFWPNYVKTHSGKLPKNWAWSWREFYKNRVHVNEEVLEIVRKLEQKGYLVPMLSDTIPSHDSVNRGRGVYEWFSPVFLSFETKLSKPNENAFRHVLKVIELPADECLFIDDLPENVAGANQVGIHGILFRGTSDLVKKLESFNVNLK